MMNSKRRERILEQITQFVQTFVNDDLVDAIESDDVTYEEILVKFNLSLVRAVRCH